mmetsp:Transcript_28216/g.28507  ORF Transcript_28216/g.28507 Transcript_28216/m.28507 type:complete len:356 (-) Transcript_28216:11-1078(-)
MPFSMLRVVLIRILPLFILLYLIINFGMSFRKSFEKTIGAHINVKGNSRFPQPIDIKAYFSTPKRHKEYEMLRLEQLDVFYMKSVNRRIYIGAINRDRIIMRESYGIRLLERIKKEVEEERKSCVAVDVGMNDGFFTNIAAVLGCNVYSFEMQTPCIDIAIAALIENKIENQVRIFSNPVSNMTGNIISTNISHKHGCSVMFSFDRKDVNFVIGPTRYFTTVALDNLFLNSSVSISSRITDTVETIDFLKIDTEGHDPQVLLGSESLFQHRRIRYCMMEGMSNMWSPPHYYKYFEIWIRIMSYGYTIHCLSASDNGTETPDAPAIIKLYRYDMSTSDLWNLVKASKCYDYLISRI